MVLRENKMLMTFKDLQNLKPGEIIHGFSVNKDTKISFSRELWLNKDGWEINGKELDQIMVDVMPDIVVQEYLTDADSLSFLEVFEEGNLFPVKIKINEAIGMFLEYKEIINSYYSRLFIKLLFNNNQSGWLSCIVDEDENIYVQ